MNLTRTATTVESDNLPRSHSYRENYKQLKNTEIGKKAQHLLSQYQMVSPENILTRNITQAEQAALIYNIYVCILHTYILNMHTVTINGGKTMNLKEN